jgi:hypothetical protein
MKHTFVKHPIFKKSEEHYVSEDGSVIQREYGMSPNGSLLNGKWVLRNSAGKYVDHDQYRNDLAERNNISL